MLKTLQWAIHYIAGTETTGRPANWKVAVVACRAVAALLPILVAHLLILTTRSKPLGALLATCAIIILDRLTTMSGPSSGPYVTAKLLVRPSSNPEYNLLRLTVAYAGCLIIRPCLIFSLCVNGAQLWLLPIYTLSACAMSETTAPENPTGTSELVATSLSAWLHWLTAIVASILVCLCYYARLHTVHLFLGCTIMTVIAFFLPLQLRRLAAHPAVAAIRQNLRALALFVSEIILFVIAILVEKAL